MRSLPLAATAAVVAAGIGCAELASAATVISHDPRGDATARYDLTNILVTNTSTTLAFTVHVRSLSGGRTQIVGMNLKAPREMESSVYLTSVRRANGLVRSTVVQNMPDGGQELLCRPKVSWRLAKNLIQGSIPRNCIPEPGDLQYEVFLGAGNGTAGDPADWTRKFITVPQS